jgi:DNA-binding NtrC family response regulator
MAENKRRARILIIDDEQYWISFATNDLSMFQIVVAHTREQAIAEIEKDNFDLVIASSSCIDLLKSIVDKYPVVVSTMEPSVQEARDAFEQGAWRYITKSFGQSDLVKQISEVISIPEHLN